MSDHASTAIMGKADWIWDDELGVHVPCCTVRPIHVPSQRPTQEKCGNGPLTGDQILTGDCGEHGSDSGSTGEDA